MAESIGDNPSKVARQLSAATVRRLVRSDGGPTIGSRPAEASMRIAITGSRGQLGTALERVFARQPLMPIDLPEHDITDLAAITADIGAFEPDLIIHTAAMTDVDACEREPELAYRVNALGARN